MRSEQKNNGNVVLKWIHRSIVSNEETPHMDELHLSKKLPVQGADGFTLIEVLIALAIFSIGILAVGTMQLSSTSGNTSARIYTESSVWAQDMVEMLMQLDYDDPQLVTGNHASTPIANTNNYSVGYRVWDNASGAIAGAVTPMLNGKTPSARTKIIEVTVTGRDNRSSTLAFVRSEDL